MQLSTNLPCGPNAIREHLVSGEVLPMNVSPEADRDFLSELERPDPKRYTRLAKAIMIDAVRQEAARMAAPDLTVRQAASGRKTPRTFKVCSGCGRRFLARRANNTTCSDRCRKRVTRIGPVSQITESTSFKAA
jgi:hypothetical protein